MSLALSLSLSLSLWSSQISCNGERSHCAPTFDLLMIVVMTSNLWPSSLVPLGLTFVIFAALVEAYGRRLGRIIELRSDQSGQLYVVSWLWSRHGCWLCVLGLSFWVLEARPTNFGLVRNCIFGWWKSGRKINKILLCFGKLYIFGDELYISK